MRSERLAPLQCPPGDRRSGQVYGSPSSRSVRRTEKKFCLNKTRVSLTKLPCCSTEPLGSTLTHVGVKALPRAGESFQLEKPFRITEANPI